MSGYSGYGGYAPAGGYGGSTNTTAAGGGGGNVRARRAPPPPPGRRPGGGGGPAAASTASGTPSKPNYAGGPSAAQTQRIQPQQQQQQHGGGGSNDWYSSTATTGNSGGGYGGMASTGAAPAPAPAASSYYGTSAPAPAAPAPGPAAPSSDPFGYSSGGTSQMAGGIGGTSTNAQQNQGQQQATGSTTNSNLPYSVPTAWDPNMSGPMGGGGAGGSSSANGASNAIGGGPTNGTGGGGAGYSPVDYDNEPPLLEELGINMGHIGTKSRAVVLPFSRYASGQLDRSVMEDSDLAGPLVFALALGGELLLSGKVSFGYIYGFGLFGCFALALVLNLMSPTDAISVWTVTSILGYALLPVNALAGINVVLRISRLGVLGVLLAAVVIIWCTVASTRLFESGCGLRDQRYLVGYPIALIYSAFVIITIF